MAEAQATAEGVFQRRRKRQQWERRAYFVTSFALLLVVWEGCRALGLINPKLFPSIWAVLQSAAAQLRNGSLQQHMYASFLRVLTSFSIGIALAVVFGFLIGWFRTVRLLLDPVINFFRALPPIALIPLMIIFFGIGETSKIIVLSYASFFPALVVIYQALVSLDPIYIRAARTLGATNMEIFRKIILPQLVPHIITACRVSLGVCWATLVAAELIAAQRGIGAMMVEAQNFFQMPPLVLGIILIGIISLVMDAIVRAIETRATRWQEKMSS
jgi:NitT/TauT family transport system permease protein